MIKEKILNLPLIMIKNKMCIKWNSKISGLYAWVNEINNKIYIGKTNNLYKRIYDEMNNFKNGKHQNLKKLFNAIQKYGIENFRVVKLLECPEEYLNKIEKLLIEYYNTKKNGYNCTYGGEGTFGHIVTKNQIQKQKNSASKYWTDEKKKEWSEKMKLWFYSKSKELQDEMRSGNKWWLNKEFKEKHLKNTRKSLTTERIEKQRNSINRYYEKNNSKKSICFSIIDPDGNEINTNSKFGGLSAFCKKYKLSYINISKVIHNKKLHHKGWHMKGINPIEHGFKIYELIDLQGKVYNFYSIKKFCKEKNLDYYSIKSVIYGKLKHHKYFHLKTIPIENCINNYNKKYINIAFENKDGSIIKVDNPKEFCISGGFSLKYLGKFLRIKNIGDYFHNLRLVSK